MKLSFLAVLVFVASALTPTSHTAPQDGALLSIDREWFLESGAAPRTLHLDGLQWNRQPVELLLNPMTVRGVGFTCYAWSEKQGLAPVARPMVDSFMGTVAGVPGSRVMATAAPAGVLVRIDWPDGERWRIEPVLDAQATTTGGILHEQYVDPLDPWQGECGTCSDHGAEVPVWRAVPEQSTAKDSTAGGLGSVRILGLSATGSVAASNPRPRGPLVPAGPMSPVPTCMHRAQIAFDADYEFYQLKGSSVPNVLAYIQQALLEVNEFYARDVQIHHVLTALVVRTAPFYNPVSGGDLLNQFRSEWNFNMGSIERDMAHLMTDKPGGVIEFGGLAWVGVVCTGFAYGWSRNGANIIGHEVGHNWGAGHCLDPSPCNNMCGACFSIGPNTRDVIAAHRDSRHCIEPDFGYRIALPPYVHQSATVQVSKSALAAGGAIEWDPLEGAADANCDQVSILQVDGVSARGATVTLAATMGGGQVARYMPEPIPFVGQDTVGFTLIDSSGQATGGVWTLDVRADRLAAYWEMDGSSSTVVADRTRAGIDAQSSQSLTRVPGRFGTGIRFDGNGQTLTTGATSFDGDWTFALWVLRLGNPASTEHLIESDNGSIRINQFGATDNVGVTLYGVVDSVFPVSVPQGVWSHLAFVGTGSGTEFYLNGQSAGQVSTRIKAPLGTIGSGGTLSAVLDEVRVYDVALGPADISELSATGGPVQNPIPEDDGQFALVAEPLAWIGAPGWVAQDFYLGSSYLAVRDATPGSLEYVGLSPMESQVVQGLARGQKYFWRVDAVGFLGTQTGAVWSFEVPRMHRWDLDEVTGTVVVDSSEGFNGQYQNGCLLGESGASGSLGFSAFFDGSNDHAVLPALNLSSAGLTITAWVRRSGSQPEYTGLVFSRSSQTIGGLNFGTGNELRYHWGSSSSVWSFNSGLVVPDDVWTFVALQVKPDGATFYMEDGGALLSTHRSATHAMQPFEGSMNLGRDPAFSQRYFRGWMDDVRVFRAAVGESEIQRIYEATRQ